CAPRTRGGWSSGLAGTPSGGSGQTPTSHKAAPPPGPARQTARARAQGHVEGLVVLAHGGEHLPRLLRGPGAGAGVVVVTPGKDEGLGELRRACPPAVWPTAARAPPGSPPLLLSSPLPVPS